MRAVERGLTPPTWPARAAAHGRDDWRAAAPFMRAVRRAFDARPRRRLRLRRADPRGRRRCSPTSDAARRRERAASTCVFVDEYQDTDPAQDRAAPAAGRRRPRPGGRRRPRPVDLRLPWRRRRGHPASSRDRFRTRDGEPAPVVGARGSAAGCGPRPARGDPPGGRAPAARPRRGEHRALLPVEAPDLPSRGRAGGARRRCADAPPGGRLRRRRAAPRAPARRRAVVADGGAGALDACGQVPVLRRALGRRRRARWPSPATRCRWRSEPARAPAARCCCGCALRPGTLDEDGRRGAAARPARRRGRARPAPAAPRAARR